jgi:membrane protein required for colicin V production
MNWLDYVLIVILAFSALSSLRRGLTRELIGIAAALAAIVLGMWFYGTAGALVRPHVGSDRVANFVGFLLIFGGVILAGALAGAIVRRFVKAVGLSFFDKLLGAAFGLLRGAVICIALLTGYIAFGHSEDSKTAPSSVVHSQIAPYLMEASRVVVDAAPMEMKRSFREEYDKVKLEILRRAQFKDNDDGRQSGSKDAGER